MTVRRAIERPTLGRLAVAEQVRIGDEIANLVARDSDVFCALRIWSTANADKEPAGRKGALFAGQAILQSDGSQEFIAVKRGHNGIGEHFHISRRQDAVDEVCRKSSFEGIAADDHGDFSRYPGKRQGGLTGGVAGRPRRTRARSRKGRPRWRRLRNTNLCHEIGLPLGRPSR